MRYEMEYGSGSGQWYDGGKWEIKESPKTVSFTCIEEPFFESNMPKKARLRKDNLGEHKLEVNDEEYTVYPYRNGIPHVFTKLLNK